MAVISFHSFEDAIVKHTFQRMAGTLKQDGKPLGVLITKHPITATSEEIVANFKARSGRLRVIEKC